MKTRQVIGWAVLALATLAAAIGPDLIRVPEPTGVIVLVMPHSWRTTMEPARLPCPHAIFPKADQPTDTARYILTFDLPAKSGEDLFLFLPSINKRMAVSLNGEAISGFDSGTLWTGLLLSSPVLLRLPRLALRPGHTTRLTLSSKSAGLACRPTCPRSMSVRKTVLPRFTPGGFFVQNQLKVMTLGAYLLLSLGSSGQYFFVRPIRSFRGSRATTS